MQEWKNPIPTSAATSGKPWTFFDCNICLDLACNPVVTLCGHLYCWPCIHKWIITQTASLPLDQLPQCPVCKAETSIRTVVPLYGMGQDHEMKEEAIPPRPRGLQCLAIPQRPHDPFQNMHYNPSPSDYWRYSEARHGQSSMASPALSHPMVAMLGDMVYTGVFGNSGGVYAVPNSYYSAGNSTPRLRRRQLEADKALNRVSIFLFCGFLVCLLLF